MDEIIQVIISSYFAVSLLGVLTHFFHKWFKKGVLVHVFSAVNESVWEHMKLSFYPMTIAMLIHSLIPGFYYEGFLGTAFLTVLVATILVPFLYYPIRALIRREVLAISIGLYFLCILLAFILEYNLLQQRFAGLNSGIAIIGFLLVFLAFAYFTYFPLKLPIFRDSIYGKYGEFRQKFDRKKRKS